MKQRVHIQWVSFFLLVMLCFSVLFGMPMTVSASSVDGEKAETIGTSLYDVSTALTAYVNRVLSPNTNDKHPSNKVTELSGNNVGNAGAFVGYGDVDKDFTAFVVSNMSGSASTSTYSSWIGVEDSGSNNTIYGYCRYGFLLSDLGLDQTAPATTGISLRTIVGVIVYGVFSICSFVSQVFYMAFELLSLLNPFKLFTSATNTGMSAALKGALPLIGYDGAVSSALMSVANWFGRIYSVLDGISWHVTIPVFFAVLVASLLLMRHGDRTHKVLTFVKRIAFIAIGIPVLGILYTNCLDSMMDEMSEGSNVAATQMVGSTFVDFERWVTEGRLSPPGSGAVLTSVGKGDDASTEAGAASDEAVMGLRKTAWTINKKTGLISSGINASFSNNYDIAGGVWDTDGELKEDGESDSSTKTKDRILAMLERYIRNDFYQASAWEASVNNALNANHGDDMGHTPGTPDANSNDNTVYGMFDETDEVDDWMDREDSDNGAIINGSKWSSFNIFSNGNLRGGSSGATANITYRGSWPTGDAFDPSTKGGLSTVSMYNYLSSSFSQASITTYSAEQSSSEYTKQAHYSVNMIGTGILQFLFGMNCVIVLGVMSLIGVFYAFGMTLSNIKRSFSLIVAVPTAVLGVMKQIAQVIVYAIMMMMEIIGTAFMYTLVGELLAVFATVTETLARSAVNGTLGGDLVETTILGGYFGAFGVSVPASMLTSSDLTLYGSLIATTVLIALFGVVVLKYRRRVFAVHAAFWIWMMRLVTFEEMMPVFEQVVAGGRKQHRWVLSPVCFRKQRVALQEL